MTSEFGQLEPIRQKNQQQILCLIFSLHKLLKHSPTYTAYFLVHSLDILSYFSLFVLYRVAISGTRGSSGFGSVNREHIDNNTLLIVRAGLQLFFKISKHIPPLLLILG